MYVVHIATRGPYVRPLATGTSRINDFKLRLRPTIRRDIGIDPSSLEIRSNSESRVSLISCCSRELANEAVAATTQGTKARLRCRDRFDSRNRSFHYSTADLMRLQATKKLYAHSMFKTTKRRDASFESISRTCHVSHKNPRFNHYLVVS